MPFRRRSDHMKTSQTKNRAARRRAVEGSPRFTEVLESRTLLTAVVNGLFQGTGTPFDGTPTFQYTQPGETVPIKISISGNLTAEFIGGTWDPTQPHQVALTDLGVGTSLFSIYVVKSDMNCTISIAGLTGTPPSMDPFTGSQTLRFNNATSGASATVALDGQVYVGVRSPTNLQAPANNIPFYRSDQRVFGMRPSSAGDLFAGLEVAPGNSLGRFYLGGTITGLVDVPGSMITFYANTILTGNAEGLSSIGTSDLHKNFHIGEDIQSLVVENSFGTNTIASAIGGDPGRLESMVYKTGFQLDVGGRVSYIHAADSFLGQAVIHNSASTKGAGIAQDEFEFRGQPQPAGFSYFDPQIVGNKLAVGQLAPSGLFNNDSFDTAQWLGTLRSQELKNANIIQLNGSLGSAFGAGGDTIDFYAVSLLAGQKMQVQLRDQNQIGTTAFLRLGIFDPDDRLIETDYTKIKNGTRAGEVIQINATKPGSYRIAVARVGDANFNGAVDGGEAVTSLIPAPYQLRVSNVGDIALGGLIAEGSIGTTDTFSPTAPSSGRSIQVLRDDLGEVRAGLLAGSNIFSEANAWYVPAGNLRAIESFAFGIFAPFATVNVGATGPDILVRKGSVGLIRSAGAGQVLSFNDDQSATASVLSDQAIYPSTAADLSLTPVGLAIGGNYQLVDCAGVLQGSLLAMGSIGSIRAQQTAFPVWQVNVDGAGSRGQIDLIDIAGDGNAATVDLASPAITTGPNGNVRYVKLEGNALFSRDTFFGGGVPEPTIYGPGVRANLTDDNGTQVTLTPLPLTRNSIGGTSGQPPLIDPSQLSVLTMPIRDKAGQAIIRVIVSAPVDDLVAPLAIGGGGLQVDSGANGSVEIGEVDVTAGSSAETVTFSPFTRQYTVTATVPPVTTPATPVRNLDVLFQGSSPIDIWQIDGAAGQVINSINNRTSGEIVNLTGGPDIVSLTAETVGLAKSSTGSAVEGINVLQNLYPFNQQRNLITVGNLVAVSARRGLGNIFAQNIGTVVANSDGKNVGGVFEGINAPVVSVHPTPQTVTATDPLTGNIVSVRIGEGVLPSGSGLVGFSGIYADGLIDAVSGSKADIRGTVVASGITTQITQPAVDAAGNPILDAFGNPVTQSTPTAIISSVRLTNGSIIGANVSTLLFVQTQESSNAVTFFDNGDTIDQPVFDIGSIRLDGNGGIMGSFIAAADIGPIAINSGFGIINSEVDALGGGGTINGIVTDGYGVRDTLVTGGAVVQQIIARGKGKRLDTTSFSGSVRASENGTIDPVTGFTVDALSDLHKYLGTTKAAPKRKGFSDAGNIEDSQIVASRDLGTVQANRILARNPFTRDPLTGVKTAIPPLSPAYPMRISFGNSINKIVTGDVIDGLTMTGGGINLFQAGNDVTHTNINVSGRINQINALGGLLGTTTIKTIGSAGNINSISTRRSLYATINSSLDIGTLKVGTDLGSPSVSVSRNINNLSVHGSILTGGFVRAKKTINSLFVGGDIKKGATVQAGAIANQTINGQVIGDIVIT